MRENGIKFRFYSEAKYATDVIFQQKNRPCGNASENKKYVPGKHHLYGHKTKVFVLPNEVSIGYSKSFSGSADISIFPKRLQWHGVSTEKDEEEAGELRDDGDISSRFSNHWEYWRIKLTTVYKIQLESLFSKNFYQWISDRC